MVSSSLTAKFTSLTLLVVIALCSINYFTKKSFQKEEVVGAISATIMMGTIPGFGTTTNAQMSDIVAFGNGLYIVYDSTNKVYVGIRCSGYTSAASCESLEIEEGNFHNLALDVNPIKYAGVVHNQLYFFNKDPSSQNMQLCIVEDFSRSGQKARISKVVTFTGDLMQYRDSGRVLASPKGGIEVLLWNFALKKGISDLIYDSVSGIPDTVDLEKTRKGVDLSPSIYFNQMVDVDIVTGQVPQLGTYGDQWLDLYLVQEAKKMQQFYTLDDKGQWVQQGVITGDRHREKGPLNVVKESSSEPSVEYYYDENKILKIIYDSTNDIEARLAYQSGSFLEKDLVVQIYQGNPSKSSPLLQSVRVVKNIKSTNYSVQGVETGKGYFSMVVYPTDVSMAGTTDGSGTQTLPEVVYVTFDGLNK